MRVPQRGRAILRQLSARDSARGFRPGDFLLTTSDGALAKLQGWATGCELNHAALIIDQLGTVVEANPSLLRDARPFRLASVKDYLGAGKPCWIGYVELREGSRQDVAAYAQHLLRGQKDGSATGRAWLALHTLFGIAPRALTGRVPWLNGLFHLLNDHAVVVREEHCYLAGELVARALERGGFIWESDPAYVTPADLLTSFHQLDAVLEPLQFTSRRATSRIAASAAPRRDPVGSALAAAEWTRNAGLVPAAFADVDASQAGIQALARVGVLMAASLAVIGLVEETIRFVARDI
jgi:hypothetical protein